MERATGVDLETGEMHVVDTSLKSHHIATLRAFNRGTPTAASERTRITLSCSALHASSDAERDYLHAFQLPSSHLKASGHIIFEGHIESVRYLVPALVLLRTFFTPARCMLAMMFRPHALDQTCFLDFEPPSNDLIMLSGWATDANARRYGPWEPRLKWMLSHPSAFRMAGSVHEFTSRGIIGLSLPLAKISAVFEGVRSNNDFYITKPTLITIEPKESPYAYIKPTLLVDLHNNSNFLMKEQVGTQRVNKLPVPPHANGQIDLTDGE